jgi:cell division septum initiation protein DivIVA
MDWMLECVMKTEIKKSEVKELLYDVEIDVACLIEEANDMAITLTTLQTKVAKLRNALDKLSDNSKA